MHTNHIDSRSLEHEIEQERTWLGHRLDAVRDGHILRDLSTELGERFHDWEEPAVRFVRRHPVSVGLAAVIASAALARRSRRRPTGWLHRAPEPTARALVAELFSRGAAATRRTNKAARRSATALQARTASMAGDAFHRAADVSRHAGEHVRYGGHEAHEQVVGLARREPVLFGILAMLVGAALRSALARRRLRAGASTA